MKTLLALVTGFVGGCAFISWAISENIDDGDVICNNDDFYVKAETDKKYGYGMARVFYKNPENTMKEEEA